METKDSVAVSFDDFIQAEIELKESIKEHLIKCFKEFQDKTNCTVFDTDVTVKGNEVTMSFVYGIISEHKHYVRFTFENMN